MLTGGDARDPGDVDALNFGSSTISSTSGELANGAVDITGEVMVSGDPTALESIDGGMKP